MKLDAVKWGGSLLLIIGLTASSAWTAWVWQANAYDKTLAKQEAAHQTTLTHLANANSALILAEQGKRLALEQWLAASDQAHYRALTDAKTNQARLRDRIATADLRLSVLLDTTAANGSDEMQATPSPGRVVHGTHRAQLDRAHAQRIIGITGDGDQGLIALQACQAYAKGVSRVQQEKTSCWSLSERRSYCAQDVSGSTGEGRVEHRLPASARYP